MRILLLTNLYPPHILGGAEITARDIALGLRMRSHEVTVITSWYGLSTPQQDQDAWRILKYTPVTHFDKQESVSKKVTQLTNYYNYYHNAHNAHELRRAISIIKPDVVYIWEITGLGVISILELLPQIHVPIVFHLGSYWYQYAHTPQTDQSQLKLRWFKKLLIGQVPAMTYSSIIAVSAGVKEQYEKAGCDPACIEIINSGIDPFFLAEPSRRKIERDSDTVRRENTTQAIQLLFVGRICAEKGVLVILKALELLHKKQLPYTFHLTILGDGDKAYIEELHHFLQEKSLEKVVTFQGKVSQEELLTYYDTSDIMLVPSIWQEPFGLVLVEAMARRLPVIASRVAGPLEIITHEQDGILVEPGDVVMLAERIMQLAEDADMRRLLSHNAHKTVVQRFTIEENIRRVEQHLIKVKTIGLTQSQQL